MGTDYVRLLYLTRTKKRWQGLQTFAKSLVMTPRFRGFFRDHPLSLVTKNIDIVIVNELGNLLTKFYFVKISHQLDHSSS